MKKLMIILLLLLPMCLGHAEDVHEYRSGDWIYTLEENGTAAIWEYTGRDEHVGIPAELDGHPVAAVRSGWRKLNRPVKLSSASRLAP